MGPWVGNSRLTGVCGDILMYPGAEACRVGVEGAWGGVRDKSGMSIVFVLFERHMARTESSSGDDGGATEGIEYPKERCAASLSSETVKALASVQSQTCPHLGATGARTCQRS